MHINRRDIIAAGLLSSIITSQYAFAQKINKFPFTLGVASGDPWSDGFVIWTKLAPSPLEKSFGMPNFIFEVEWQISTDIKFKNIIKKGKANAIPEYGHSCHVEIFGLMPSTTYYYRFIFERFSSQIGKVKTAPLNYADISQVKIGVAGCQNYEHGYFTAYKYMSDENFDAIFHYGDYIYEGAQGRKTDIPVIREHIGPEPYNLDAYRLRYAQYKLDQDLQSAHASCAFLMTYDDHEIDNNWASSFDQDGTNPEIFIRRKIAALQAWYENMPMRPSQIPKNGSINMYRRIEYGKLLRIHLLDTRQYRDDQVCENDQKNKNCRPLETLKSGNIIGNEQTKWLTDGLSDSFTWNLIAQQVVVMPFDKRNGIDSPTQLAADAWDGYPSSREALIKAIKAKNIKNCVIATGDIHQNLVGYLPENELEPEKNQMAVEFVCTSISSLGDGKDIKVRGADFRKIIARNPNILYANGQRGYHSFTITNKYWQTDIMKVDKVTDKTGKLSRLTGFTLDTNSPLVIPS